VEHSFRARIWSYRDNPLVHFGVGALVVFFVLSPALFTPWGFGPDYTNHLWLVWQQAMAISNAGHPSLYLQLPGGIFEPFFGFYGGSLYAIVGAAVALVGTGHAYSVYIASIGGAIALAYGGMWWLGRLVGLSRWVSHLPAFVVVTGGYYLTDAYARGAWPELFALSAVPMVIAGAVRLLTSPWRPWPVALFALGVVLMTGSHNITLLWSIVLLGPFALVALILLWRERPPQRRIWATLGLAVLGGGVNAWFLLVDLSHASDVAAWAQDKLLIEGGGFAAYFYFDNLGNVLNPLRVTPHQSSTYGLTIAPPLVAFALSLALAVLAWPTLKRVGRWVKTLWLMLLATMAVLVGLLVMPASWWEALGAPLVDIQFPYRLAGWLLIALAVQLAVSLRLARGMSATRRQVATILALAVVAATVTQAAAQMYSAKRVDHHHLYHLAPAREAAFARGTEPPETWYDPYSYADSSLPQVETEPNSSLVLSQPRPGQTELREKVELPQGKGPISTNIAGGPYVVRVGGFKVIGRTAAGASVLERPPGHGKRVLTVTADAGFAATAGAVISILCLAAIVILLAYLAARPRLRRGRPATAS
jgi:hypothetical protein